MHAMSQADTQPVVHENARLKILVVDDEPTNRLILESMLRREGYAVASAQDGRQAIEDFVADPPDMILLDVMMPVMDGYETVKAVKALAADRFVPVIFLTALTDDDSLTRCLSAGGDDFLTKPYNADILRAKIRAFARTLNLYSELQEKRRELALHNERVRTDYELSENVLTSIVGKNSFESDNIQYFSSPKAISNGDIVLVGMTPDGRQQILLGDFTGHGLSAALGALPVSDIFSAMSAKGYGIRDIGLEINRKLHERLPANLFMAACLVELDLNANRTVVINCGMPDIVVKPAGSAAAVRLASANLPLGIESDESMDLNVHSMSVQTGTRLLLCTDGILEGRDSVGAMFGPARIDQLLQANRRPERLFREICDAYQTHTQTGEQHDDATLVEIHCDEALRPKLIMSKSSGAAAGRSEWTLSLRLDAPLLRRFSPIPMLIETLATIDADHSRRVTLFTILSELYNNALDHGVLCLDSTVKDGPEGFSRYYSHRAQALATLQEGYIEITLSRCSTDGDTTLRIGVRSGTPRICRDPHPNVGPRALATHGRGLHLVRSLCNSLEILDNGRIVEAVYVA